MLTESILVELLGKILPAVVSLYKSVGTCYSNIADMSVVTQVRFKEYVVFLDYCF